jgi:hypothetical protein
MSTRQPSAEDLLNTPGMVEHEYQQVGCAAASPYPTLPPPRRPTERETERRATAVCSTSEHVGCPARASRVR